MSGLLAVRAEVVEAALALEHFFGFKALAFVSNFNVFAKLAENDVLVFVEALKDSVVQAELQVLLEGFLIDDLRNVFLRKGLQTDRMNKLLSRDLANTDLVFHILFHAIFAHSIAFFSPEFCLVLIRLFIADLAEQLGRFLVYFLLSYSLYLICPSQREEIITQKVRFQFFLFHWCFFLDDDLAGVIVIGDCFPFEVFGGRLLLLILIEDRQKAYRLEFHLI